MVWLFSFPSSPPSFFPLLSFFFLLLYTCEGTGWGKVLVFFSFLSFLISGWNRCVVSRGGPGVTYVPIARCLPAAGRDHEPEDFILNLIISLRS
ncbi:hypothetical protein DFH27DRAFT_570750 [Peziza echinospora]|nr:hypothetical protein DFH27DRAFT_570750 [Peziza echinospora]